MYVNRIRHAHIISRDVTFEESKFPFKHRREEVATKSLNLNDTIWRAFDVEHHPMGVPEMATESEIDISSSDESFDDERTHNEEGNGNIEEDREDGNIEEDREDGNIEEDREDGNVDDREDGNIEEDREDIEEDREDGNVDDREDGNVDEPQQRQSRAGRQLTKPNWMKDYKCNTAESLTKKSDPQSPAEALKGPDSHRWKQAMLEETENLLRNDTFTILKGPKPKQRAIRCKWIFKTKYDEKGNLARHRARLVALGNTQRPGLDFDQTYSLVVQMKTTRILFGIAAEKNWAIHHLDIKAACLNANIDEDVYIETPENFQELCEELRSSFRHIPPTTELQDTKLKLKKSIYGLHQSGRLWNIHLDKFLKSQGLLRSRGDPCLYYCKNKEFLITTYVLYGSLENIEHFKKAIQDQFEVKDLGEAKHILSMRVRRTQDAIILDQTLYANELLESMSMLNSKPVSTPLCLGAKYQCCQPGQELSEEKAVQYRHAVGSLLYLATHTRPDLSFATSYLSKFNQNPSTEHWTGMQHVLRYLNGTKALSIHYQKSNKKMDVFTDSDWGSDIEDRRSFSGYVIKVGGAAVSWSCKKQKCTALSTVEAEFVALSECGKECTWIRNMLEEIGQAKFLGNPLEIKIDNQGAMKLSENPTTSERSKHIDLRLFHIRDLIEAKKIKLTYVASQLNLADGLTKVLPSPKMKQHLESLGIIDPGGVLDDLEEL